MLIQVLQVLSLDFKSLSTYCNNNESILCIFSAKRVITKNSREHAIFEEESTLKIKRIKLQNEQLELQNYKLRLEILEKEMSMNLEKSAYTADLI